MCRREYMNGKRKRKRESNQCRKLINLHSNLISVVILLSPGISRYTCSVPCPSISYSYAAHIKRIQLSDCLLFIHACLFSFLLGGWREDKEPTTFRSESPVVSYCVRWWPLLLLPRRHPHWLDSIVWRSCCWPSTWTSFHLKVQHLQKKQLDNGETPSQCASHFRTTTYQHDVLFEIFHPSSSIRVIGWLPVSLLFRGKKEKIFFFFF